MSQEKRIVELHIDLLPLDVTHDEGKHRLDLTRNITLDFVPFPGLNLWLTPDLPDERRDQWSPLLKAARGPRGNVGLGLNTDIWQVDKVFYSVKQEQFCLGCYPKLETVEQFHALRDLLIGYYGFHIDRHMPL